MPALGLVEGYPLVLTEEINEQMSDNAPEEKDRRRLGEVDHGSSLSPEADSML